MSKEEKSPAFQWYPKDILTSQRVLMMSLAEEGAYRRAIDICWLHGWVPNDAKKLAQVIGKGCTTKIAQGIMGMFLIHPDDPAKLIHERLEQERNKQSEWRKKSSAAGKKSAAIRKEKANQPSNQTGNQISTTVEPTLENGSNQNPTLQSSSSSSSSYNSPHTPQGDDVGGMSFDIEKEVLAAFGFSEMKNANLFMQQAKLINAFCNVMHGQNMLDHFTEQFTCYMQYKRIKNYGGFSFKNYIGTQASGFSDGKWNDENWVAKLKEVKQIDSGQNSKSGVLPGKGINEGRRILNG